MRERAGEAKKKGKMDLQRQEKSGKF